MPNFICFPPFRPNFLHSEIEFYFIFYYFNAECIKRQKELIGSDDDNGISSGYKRSFRRQIFLPSPKVSELSYKFLFLHQITSLTLILHILLRYNFIITCITKQLKAVK